MDQSERAAAYFAQGYNCAQSVLMAQAQEGQAIAVETAARLASALGGGMARTGQTCGAVTGALLALGLGAGSTDPADKNAKERAYALARRLMEAFSARHGSTDCPGLLGGCHIGTPAGAAEAREKGYFKTRCPAYVRDAAALAQAVLRGESGQ